MTNNFAFEVNAQIRLESTILDGVERTGRDGSGRVGSDRSGRVWLDGSRPVGSGSG